MHRRPRRRELLAATRRELREADPAALAGARPLLGIRVGGRLALSLNPNLNHPLRSPMPTTQPAVVNFSRPERPVELRQVPVPDIEPDDVLLEVAGRRRVRERPAQWTADQSWPVNYPVVLGHEFGGRDRASSASASAAGARATASSARRRPSSTRTTRMIAQGPLQPRPHRARASATASTAR